MALRRLGGDGVELGNKQTAAIGIFAGVGVGGMSWAAPLLFPSVPIESVWCLFIVSIVFVIASIASLIKPALFQKAHKIEFVSLQAVVLSIAERLKLPPHLADQATMPGKPQEILDAYWQVASKATAHEFDQLTVNQRIEHARRFSFAANLLNKALHDSTAYQVQWMETDTAKGFAVRSSSVEQEARELLTQAKTWGPRRQENYCTYIRNALERGSATRFALAGGASPDNIAREIAIAAMNNSNDKSGWTEKQTHRWQQIGFDKASIGVLLAASEIAHDLTAA